MSCRVQELRSDWLLPASAGGYLLAQFCDAGIKQSGMIDVKSNFTGSNRTLKLVYLQWLLANFALLRRATVAHNVISALCIHRSYWSPWGPYSSSPFSMSIDRDVRVIRDDSAGYDAVDMGAEADGNANSILIHCSH